jgi:hypothetical protein
MLQPYDKFIGDRMEVKKTHGDCLDKLYIYNNSQLWNKVIGAWFPLLKIIPVTRSEVVTIYMQIPEYEPHNYI